MWRNLREKISRTLIQPKSREYVKPTISMNEHILCDCSDCQIESRGLFESLPLENGHWTSCSIHKCKDCGRMGGFPQENLEDAIVHGTPETKEALRGAGIPIDEFIIEFNKKHQITDEKLNPSRRDEE
jgi:hypothetical protein